jgi:hypothetical protein
MKRILDWMIDRLIAYAKHTPCTHLFHGDGAPYMERYWIARLFGYSIRLHHIQTVDYDRHMHNHPWSFASLVLRGWYVERRPLFDEPTFGPDLREFSTRNVRSAGSLEFRFHEDRHLITEVSPGGVWTMIFTGKKSQPWGFFTESGFVKWRDYSSCRDNGQVVEV